MFALLMGLVTQVITSSTVESTVPWTEPIPEWHIGERSHQLGEVVESEVGMNKMYTYIDLI